MGGGDLNLKKSWHPHTMKNQERVWKAEQAKQEEQRKLDDLRKEINEERDREELRRIGENSGVLASSSAGGGEAKLEWMYKNSAELINREEYLLGRKIDKSFEQLQAEERRQEHTTLGVKQSINHVEHECVPFSIREYRNLQSTEQVDMQRKTMEDPLMLIKQREMESRRKLLENPVKLKEIHRILKTEQEQATKQNKKSKKSKKSKKKNKKNGSDDDSDGNDDLDRKLAKQMKKLKGEATNGDFKLDKLLDAKYRTLTKQLDMATKQKKPKTKKKSKRSRSSDSSDESSESSDEKSAKETKQSRGKRERSNSRERRERRDRRNSSDDEQAKRSRDNRTRRGRSHSSRDERYKRRERQEVSRQPDASSSRRRHSRSRSPRRDQQQQRRRSRSPERQRTQRRERSREHRQRRSPTPVKQQQQRRNPSPPPAAQRQTAKPKQKLSEGEREARLREMMDNATWREADRTKAVHKHREEYAREEAQNQARDFDKHFINKEVKKAIDNQTSIGNRIRSNLNNIQRTSAAMDSSFTRK